MSDHISRILQCFTLARMVEHYYWSHTEGNDENFRVSVENLQKIIGLMTGLKITKTLVQAESIIIRGWVERYEDRAEIFIVSSQDEPHRRFTTVKELSQILFDTNEEFQPDPLVTLKEITTDETFGLSEDLSPALQSERLAEMLALELLYPLEDRRNDKLDQKNGKELKEIVNSRLIPPVYIQRALSDGYLSACERTWKLLKDIAQPPPLKVS